MPDDFHPEVYLFADFKLDVSAERLLLEDREIPLPPKAITLLTHFVRNPHRLIKYEELIEVGWPEVDPELREVNKSKYTQQVVDLIRVALNDRHPYGIITNKTRRGYVFEAKVIPFRNSRDAELKRSDASIPDGGNPPSLDPHLVSNVAEESAGVPEVSRDEPVVAGTDGFFEHWLLRAGLNLTILTGSLVFATLLGAAVISLNSSSHAAAVVCTVSILLLILALRHLARNKPARQREEPKLEELLAAGYTDLADYEGARETLRGSLQRFTKRWRLLLISWVLLYCAYAVEFWFSPDLGANQLVPRWKVAVDISELIFNLFNTFMIAMCYEVLNKDLAPRRKRRTLNWTASLGLVVFFVTVALVIWYSLKPEQVAELRRHLQPGAALVTGILAGIIMALFVGRLQSKYLDPPAWAVFLLFSYTAIQPLVVYIHNQRQLTWALLWYALFLKALLYLYVFWLLQSGDLLFYFAQARRTYEHVDDRRRAHRRLVD